MSGAFTFAVIGDMPYKRKRDLDRFEQLIDAINRLEPAFTIHVGDIKRAKQPCTKQRYKRVHALFNLFKHPLIYTPGDNDWAECHKSSAGSYEPQERLKLVRELFFATDRTLGAEPMAVNRQSSDGRYPEMVENARWSECGYLFTTVHTVGANNNRDLDPGEYRERNEANLEWLRTAFDIAHREKLRGLVVATHANLWFGADDGPPIGFRDTIGALREGADSFAGPVLLVHGDRHELLIDKPLSRTRGGEDTIETFMRVQVMGDVHINGVAVTVEPARDFPFSVATVL